MLNQTSKNIGKKAQSSSKDKQMPQDKSRKGASQKSSNSKTSPSPQPTKIPESKEEQKQPTKEEMDKIIAKQKEEAQLKKKEDEELGRQAILKKKKEEIHERIAFEYDQRERLLDIKHKDLEKKTSAISQMQETNKKLQLDLDYLQNEVQMKLNKYEFKAKNEQFEEERQKKETPLEQLIKVKEKEITNALKTIANYKAAKEKYEKILREDKDLEQINQLNDESNLLTQKKEELKKEIVYLTEIVNRHKECEKKVEEALMQKKEMKKNINQIKQEYKQRQKEERTVQGIHVFQSERFKKTKEQNEAIMKEKIDAYWKDNSIQLNEDTVNQSLSRNSNFLNGSLKVKDWSTKLTNTNMKVMTQNSLPLLPLFRPEEKKILMDILPKKEIEKYEKRYECVDSVKSHLERKLCADTHQLTKENKDIEHMFEYSTLQLKENEQKNKLLALKINEQKRELKELKEKTSEIMRELEKTKEKEKEKELENKKLVKHLQDLQSKYEKSEVNEENNEEDGDNEEEGGEVEADYD